MDLKVVRLDFPEGCNVILGMAHFIKTVEDLYESLMNSVPGIRFGLAFCESSGPCLVRYDGSDDELKEVAKKNALELGCGHAFLIVMRDAYPINVLGQVKEVPEVCSIYAATANPLEVVVAETEQGRGIMGVIDGSHTKGVETEEDVEKRRRFLREIGYKR